jgi:hypothetical protein
MAQIHKNLTQEKWDELSRDKQILNVAAELIRAKNMLAKERNEHFLNCLERALELIDLIINNKKWYSGLKEILRFREVLGEFYIGSNKSLNDLAKLIRIFLSFNSESQKVKI